MKKLDCSPLENTAEALETAICHHVRYQLASRMKNLSRGDLYQALSLAVRDRLVERMLDTEDRNQEKQAKRLYYLSMEFLMGQFLENNLYNLDILEPTRAALSNLGVDLREICDYEPDAALGNGGLGRLAACFLDSLASLNLPGYGYGINYEFGLFKQEIHNHCQEERPDHWMEEGTPWEIERRSEACIIPVYGRVEHAADRNGDYNPMWVNWRVLIGVPHDIPIVGYGGQTVNFLRLFSARSSHEFDMKIFNQGDYIRAVEQKISSETITKVLYPSDSIEAGKELRLLQEYFLVACALRDIVNNHLRQHSSLIHLHEKAAIQLNDTHPALAVAELMRLLVDEQQIPWDKAWEITTRTLAYTNHTLMPEALEKWPVSLMAKVLPRHLQLIQEIERRFLTQIHLQWPENPLKWQKVSLFEGEGDYRQVRMAHLAILGSHSVNGVSALHTELIKSQLVPEFYELWPEKFNNKTNGVTPRRWLLKANPLLSTLITEKIGKGWIQNLDQLRQLEPYAADNGFQEEFMRIKRANKSRLARVIEDTTHYLVDPDSLFDIQIKRMHEYKRQLLCLMHVIHEYLTITEEGKDLTVPRTYIFAGKAAPGYWAAKQIIRLINQVAEVVNTDKRVGDQLKLVFIPDYRVSLAEKIIPAADLSEQISTAGKEASGTGNMKFALNGALTIGTLDGANIEIGEEVGEDNIFIFGLKAEEIQALRDQNSYDPWSWYQKPEVQRVVDTFNSTRFCAEEPGLFEWLFESLVTQDTYFHLADFPSYIAAQEKVGQNYLQRSDWAQKAILNVARVGKFSSDRTISEYAKEVWNIQPTV
ncbi:glycogen phosphorylase [bacterium (Candidatus Blackallbacteria) CG17_big_fil_post_rev_8_21_14_2_50_48_46]|uniref:Alpha-1,4 glucan phosphorylase n=1 Tax=bacterium (Candidatus Blackallbacteria) CG17_big_fil_post_rev_8_21_14_2_50_48_46 TaxID=2014261 RepID=A0A2M7G216_9BACT|nr:MAG: glycogen phosphorylase [bacterium (Candidatus Blackallbacteria) CG18_big_fil_WC_8_21_14_2_50_49_26]PIW15806.1 MAG: glycogen phosphorylase [bacterium (Candidatus Blackallbacteria) CG17_big_fil_post_rev_8_21_14_2_50_48_46]PIW47791.1 MAG: glycogen phosphorylase [bacterium (Candidatus Blackallbacteria) CG13_big_fil_rev_8_21_14_2_50_49_14]